MIAAPISSGMRGVDRVRSWLAVRHSLAAELLVVVGLYALDESTRGVVAGRRDIALRHADDVISIERSLHMFVEIGVERTAERVSGLTSTLGVLYLSLHLALTGLLLLWLYQRRPHAYLFFRTTLLVASAGALIGYLTFPTPPPRLSVDLLKNSHQNEPCAAGARCPARSFVLSRGNSAAIAAPCVLVSHAASALRRRRTILKRVLRAASIACP